MIKIDLINQRFDRLLVINKSDVKYHGHSLWECLCDCGTISFYPTGSLKRNLTKSCGCLRKQNSSQLSKNIRYRTHGHATHRKHSREYTSWQGMIQRCTNSNNPSFRYYGGRGITVCDRWRNSFIDFLNDMGFRPPNKSLDRIDNNGNYEPGNCKWSTKNEQQLNRNKGRKWVS